MNVSMGTPIKHAFQPILNKCCSLFNGFVNTCIMKTQELKAHRKTSAGKRTSFFPV